MESNFQAQGWNINGKSQTLQRQNGWRNESLKKLKGKIPHLYFSFFLFFLIQTHILLPRFFFLCSVLWGTLCCFSIASLEINQSNTHWSPEGNGEESDSLPALSHDRGAMRQIWKSALPLWTPASFKQAISEEGQEKPECFDISPLLAQPIPAGTGAWTVESLLAPAQKFWDALSLCNTKKTFSLLNILISLSFMCVCKPRSNWNWSTIEMTEKQTNWKKDNYFIYFNI